jgi:hypothetical protein
LVVDLQPELYIVDKRVVDDQRQALGASLIDRKTYPPNAAGIAQPWAAVTELAML